MARLVWDKTGERLYETGVKHGVLYPMKSDGTYDKGVAWNGLTSIQESPSGAESNKIYADDIKYLDIRSAEEFGATIQAYTYPDEWALCDGSAFIIPNQKFLKIGQQARRGFALCYRTAVGNDVELSDYSYKLHLIYGATASPSEREYQTINDSPEAIQFSWELSTTPIDIAGTNFKPTASLELDVSQIKAMPDGEDKTALLAKVKEAEDILYGTDGGHGATATDPAIILPARFIEMFSGIVNG